MLQFSGTKKDVLDMVRHSGATPGTPIKVVECGKLVNYVVSYNGEIAKPVALQNYLFR